MFRHQGKSRTLKHNLQIATVLSFVAGMVNVTGFLAFHQLTTNVTGHFALFIHDVAGAEVWKGTVYFLYIFSFLLGSFLSGLLIEKYRNNRRLNVFVIPTMTECLVLVAVVVLGYSTGPEYADMLVCLLLFAMGLQNSYVTKISNAVVRTTHLTGLFTDLGIDISHLFFPRSYPQRKRLKDNIRLRLFIIVFFFAGGLAGGFFYSALGMKLHTLLLCVLILMTSLFYDNFRYTWIRARRHYKQKGVVHRR